MPILFAAMTGRSGERMNYLSLALDARQAIKELKTFGQTRRSTPQLRAALQKSLNSVRAIASPERLYSELHDEKPYNQFEQIQTLQEVFSTLNVEGLLKSLEALLAEGELNPADLRAVLAFFLALESRAVYHYNDPMLTEAAG